MSTSVKLRREVRFPKILRSMFCPIEYNFRELSTIANVNLGHRSVQIESWSTLGPSEMKLLLAMLSFAMDRDATEWVAAELTDAQVNWYESVGVLKESIQWNGSRYGLLQQAFSDDRGRNYKKLEASIKKLIGVILTVRTEEGPEIFSLIKSAKINEKNGKVELLVNPLLSTILETDLKNVDRKLFGYFKLMFDDIKKVPASGYCLNVYLVIQCRMLELQQKSPVVYSIDQLRQLLQFDLIQDAVLRKNKVSVKSFNRQIRVAVEAVCRAMEWDLQISNGNIFSIQPPPENWYEEPGFLSVADAKVFGCFTTTFRNFRLGIDKRNSGPVMKQRFADYMTWLLSNSDSDSRRSTLARKLYQQTQPGYKNLMAQKAPSLHKMLSEQLGL